MRKVVDFGAFNSKELSSFLASSSKNVAVLCDYSAIEVFKQKHMRHAQYAFGTLCKYPTQVLILKSTSEVIKLPADRRSSPENLIDREQTRNFPQFCTLLGNPDMSVLEQGFSKHGKARQAVEKLTPQAERLRGALTALKSGLSPQVLKALRGNTTPLPDDFAENLGMSILELAMINFATLFPKQDRPPFLDALSTFWFRYSVCFYSLAIHWMIHGGHETVGTDKLRNDGIDTAYVSYATLFDGLITEDNKPREVYELAGTLIKMLSGNSDDGPFQRA